MSASDPAHEAEAYRSTILALVGDDDPAEVQAATPALLRRAVSDARLHLRERPAAKEWSVLELAGHMVDAELAHAGRYRWIVAQDEPDILAYDQDLWVDRLRHRDGDPAELLDLFDALRRANLAFWRRATSDHKARVGVHSERGRESFELTFRLAAGHDRFHLNQIDATLRSLRG